MRDDGTFTIGRLAAAAGVGIQTVRFYERRGLLAQPRRVGAAYRHYTTDHLTRLRFIRKAQNLGFSLKEIRTLLDMSAATGTTCADVKIKADRKAEQVAAKITDLQRMKRALEELSKACSVDRRAMQRCRTVECFDDGSPCRQPEQNRKRGTS